MKRNSGVLVGTLALALALPATLVGQGNGRASADRGAVRALDRAWSSLEDDARLRAWLEGIRIDPAGVRPGQSRGGDDDDDRREDDDRWDEDDDGRERARQGRGKAGKGRDRAGDREDREGRGGIGGIILGDERADARREGRREGKGPAFCRSGAGHPVFGREWCRDKGFVLGRDDVIRRNRGLEDIILRPDRERDLDRGGLGDILGDIILGRMDQRRQRLGLEAPLSGHWLVGEGARVLELRSGAIPLAALLDRNGDGRADELVVRR